MSAKAARVRSEDLSDVKCIRNMYFRPSGNTTASHDTSRLVLETDLKIDPGHECQDVRLGDLLLSLEDVIDMASPLRRDVESVEIMCSPGKPVNMTYSPLTTLLSGQRRDIAA